MAAWTGRLFSSLFGSTEAGRYSVHLLGQFLKLSDLLSTQTSRAIQVNLIGRDLLGRQRARESDSTQLDPSIVLFDGLAVQIENESNRIDGEVKPSLIAAGKALVVQCRQGSFRRNLFECGSKQIIRTRHFRIVICHGCEEKGELH